MEDRLVSFLISLPGYEAVIKELTDKLRCSPFLNSVRNEIRKDLEQRQDMHAVQEKGVSLELCENILGKCEDSVPQSVRESFEKRLQGLFEKNKDKFINAM